MKISASIYSDRQKPLKTLIKQLEQLDVDCLHVDCNDEMEVFTDLEKIRELSELPIDLHIISQEPEKFFEAIRLAKVQFCFFQFEDAPKMHLEKNLAPNLGIAITEDSPISVFEPFKNVCNSILLMTTTPGQSGGKFGRNTFQRIRDFQSYYPGHKIHVDGGVTDEVSFILRNMGVNLAVTGSYLLGSESMGLAMHRLNKAGVDSQYQVGEFMLGLGQCPQVSIEDVTLKKVLKSIEEGGLGFTNILEGRKLFGIISNADIRRQLLKDFDHLPQFNIEEAINQNPATVSELATVKELLQSIKSYPFPILYLPVVNSSKELRGVVKFNNLIKGEL